MRTRLAVFVVVLPMLLGACGGDPEPSAEALCERIASDRSKDVGAGQIPGSPEEWAAWVETFEELGQLAPPEVADALQTMKDSIAAVAETAQDGSDEMKLFDEPGYSEAQEEFRHWEDQNCDDGGGYYPGG